MQLKIERISQRVNQNGSKSYGFLSAGQWYNAWSNETTDKWKVGDVLNVDIKSRQGNDGKTYYDIVLPKPQPNNKLQNGLQIDLLKQILAELKVISKKLEKNNLDYVATTEEPPFPDECSEAQGA